MQTLLFVVTIAINDIPEKKCAKNKNQSNRFHPFNDSKIIYSYFFVVQKNVQYLISSTVLMTIVSKA